MLPLETIQKTDRRVQKTKFGLPMPTQNYSGQQALVLVWESLVQQLTRKKSPTSQISVKSVEHHVLIFTQLLMFKVNQLSSASNRDRRPAIQLLALPIKIQTRARPSRQVKTHLLQQAAISPSLRYRKHLDTQATSVKGQTQQLFHFKNKINKLQLNSLRIAHQRHLPSRRPNYKKFQIQLNRGVKTETNCSQDSLKCATCLISERSKVWPSTHPKLHSSCWQRRKSIYCQRHLCARRRR